MLLRTAFVVPSILPLRHTATWDEHINRKQRHIRRTRRLRCETKPNSTEEPDGSQSEHMPKPSQPSAEPVFGRFDAEADTDAFGRDPKKETEFWKDHAKSVLESDEVREAIEKHEKNGGDGMTDEQRAYMEFIRQLDEDKEKG